MYALLNVHSRVLNLVLPSLPMRNWGPEVGSSAPDYVHVGIDGVILLYIG